jgi:hypothetical protein
VLILNDRELVITCSLHDVQEINGYGDDSVSPSIRVFHLENRWKFSTKFGMEIMPLEAFQISTFEPLQS